eukprot:scaffold99570_cov55-Phaeocystis_antarctica.AAC.5
MASTLLLCPLPRRRNLLDGLRTARTLRPRLAAAHVFNLVLAEPPVRVLTVSPALDGACEGGFEGTLSREGDVQVFLREADARARLEVLARPGLHVETNSVLLRQLCRVGRRELRSPDQPGVNDGRGCRAGGRRLRFARRLWEVRRACLVDCLHAGAARHGDDAVGVDTLAALHARRPCALALTQGLRAIRNGRIAVLVAPGSG